MNAIQKQQVSDLAWPSWPEYAPDEIAAAMETLESGLVNYHTGNQGKLFEREFAAYVGAKRGIAMSNGTVTLEAMLRAANVGPGDEVIVTPRSFMASVSCVVAVGAVPVFADIDPESQNLSVEDASAKVSKKTKAVLPVHLNGWPADMDGFLSLASTENLTLIEDCAQAHGAMYKGRKVGTFGAGGSWSFCQDKIVTTGGEGGFVTTNDDEIADSCWAFKDHGKTLETMSRHHPPGFQWLHDRFGTNARMTEFQSAIGRVQLQKLDGWVTARRRNAQALREGLSDITHLRVPWPDESLTHSWYKFTAFIDIEALASDWSRDRIVDEINLAGVPCISGTCGELYRQRAAIQAGFGLSEPLPIAKCLADTSITLQVHPTLTITDMDRAADTVRRVSSQALR